MKKNYQTPEMEIQLLDTQDAITTSGDDNWLEWDPTAL